MKQFPSISNVLDSKDTNTSSQAHSAIEKVLQEGSIQEWREIVNSHGKDHIITVIGQSNTLGLADKRFCRFFLDSDLLHA